MLKDVKHQVKLYVCQSWPVVNLWQAAVLNRAWRKHLWTALSFILYLIVKKNVSLEKGLRLFILIPHFLGGSLYKMVYRKPTLRDTFFKRQGKIRQWSNWQLYQLYPKWHPIRASQLVNFDRKIVFFGQGSSQNLF